MTDAQPPHSHVDPTGQSVVSGPGEGAQSARTYPSGASSSLSQDSNFAILKDAGTAQDKLAQAEIEQENMDKQMTNGYIDSSGNLKGITPAQNVNLNQFYPIIDLQASAASKEDMERLSSDSWGPKSGTEDTRLGVIQEASPAAEVDQRSPVLYDSSAGGSLCPPPVSILDGRQNTTATDLGSRTDTSDSISLPATTPAGTRENTNLFSTAVDEETIAAAKLRQQNPRSKLFQTEDWEKVKATHQSMREVLTGRAIDHFAVGMQNMREQYYERAINCFNKALNLRPKEVEYYVQRAKCYLQICDFQSAILNYKRACVLQPDNFEHYSRLAFIYYFQGQCLFDQKLFPEALEAFARAAEMRPEVIGYHTRSIACLAALKRYGECLALVNKRLESEEKNADLYVMRARLHELFRNTTLCYYDVKDALALEPTHSEAITLMNKLEVKGRDLKQQAMHLNLLSRHRDALQKITLAIETNPAVAEYHVLRGALNRRIGDFNSAIDDYLLALDKTDHDEDSEVYLEAQRQLLLTYNDFAVECFTKGFYEEAIILLNKAIKGEKREKGLYINRGDCFFRQSHLQFALADYHQALEIDPGDENIRSRIAIIHNEHGIAEYMEKNPQEAESRFTLAIQHCPKVGQYYISRARARQLMENVTGARHDVIMALHLDPSNEEIMSILTRLFPGKSVKDILASRAAAAARTALQNLVVTASPVKLEPIQSTRQDFEGAVGGDSVDGIAAVLKAGGFPSIKSCMQERDFHIRIAVEKKKVTEKVKDILQKRKTLTYQGGRVGMLPEPSRHTTRSRNPLQREEPALKQTAGWRTFTVGLGLAAVPDTV